MMEVIKEVLFWLMTLLIGYFIGRESQKAE
jgi:hypothetical protein